MSTLRYWSVARFFRLKTFRVLPKEGILMDLQAQLEELKSSTQAKLAEMRGNNAKELQELRVQVLGKKDH